MHEKDRPLPKNKVMLSGVQVAYTDRGKGDPILLVHGIPTSSYLWRNVIRCLEKEFRLIAPDLMGLGDTVTPIEHRYDMAAQAEKLLELVDDLGLDRFTLVCHDQGGAAAQWLAVHHPRRIKRFIITNCVCYDNWPVPIVRFFMTLMKLAPFNRVLYQTHFGKWWGPSRLGMRLGFYDPKAVSNEAISEYMKYSRQGLDRFEQFRRFVLAGDCRYTMEAAEKFAQFKRPTYVLWAGNDRWLNVSWGRKLYDDIAGARRMEIIPFAGHFLPEENPQLTAHYIREFMQDSG